MTSKSAEKKDLKTPSGIDIKYVGDCRAFFLNQFVNVFGRSKSGKTKLVRTILEDLQRIFSTTWAINPTDPVQKVYSGMMPGGAVFKSTEHKSLLTFLTNLWNRQEIISAVFTKIDSPEFLGKFYAMAATEKTNRALLRIQALEQKIKSTFDAKIAKVGESDPDKKGELEDQRKSILDEMQQFKHKIMRKAILNARPAILQQSITDEERKCLMKIDLNPYTLLIFDDCSEKLKKLQESEIYNMMITKCRWNYMTIFMITHDIRFIVPLGRRSAHKTIYTTSDIACVGLKDRDSGGTADVKKHADEIAQTVFEGGRNRFRKLIYDGQNAQRFWCMEYRDNVDVKLGDRTFRRFMSAVSSNDINASNPMAAAM